MPDQATSPPKFGSQSIRITIKGGLDTKNLFPKSRHNGSVAESDIITKPSISRVALLGRDYSNTRFDIVADQGTTVIAGDPVLRDRKRPEICLSSPVSGTITAIKRGPRRSLASLHIEADNPQQQREFDFPADPGADDIRQLLLRSGLWATLRTRPFGHIPEPSQSPAALFITAMDTRPLAVEPTRVISSYERQFNEGLTALGQLVDCPIYLCQKPGAGLSNDNTGRITVAEFDGLHPAGLPGTHIHHLCPVGAGDREVWHIDYQDVISVGHLMQHNSPWFDRVVSLCGNGFKTPRLLLLPIGSSVSDAVQSELIDEPSRIMTGSPLFADAIGSDPAFLGLGQRQITAFRETESNNGWFPTSKATLIPTTDLDQLVPDGILAVPLLRALETADTDRARELGALELIEEDVALLGYASNTNTDYGPLLRAVLDQISQGGPINTRLKKTSGPLIHAANSMERIQQLRLCATLPVIIAACINTGHQFLIAASAGADTVGDWRASLIQNFDIDPGQPGIVGVLVAGLVHLLPPLVVAIITGGVWERIFSEARGRPLEKGFIYSAILFVLLMHPAIPLFHVVFGMSFAIVFGSAVFGGDGKTFVTPALLGAAVVQISFPAALIGHPVWQGLNGHAGTSLFSLFHEQGSAALPWEGFEIGSAFIGNTQGMMGTTSVAAIIIAAVILIYGRLASWRIVAGSLIGVIGAAIICNIIGDGILDMPWYWHLLAGSLIFGITFIATDPGASCVTNSGRWIQGVLTGLLLVLLRIVNPSHSDSMVPVLLLVSMLAPLIDHGIIWLNIRNRMRSQVE